MLKGIRRIVGSEENELASRIKVKGKKTIKGSISVSGAKNAALAIIPATILAGDTCILENVPQITDVMTFQHILKEMGAEVEQIDQSKFKVDSSTMTEWQAVSESMNSFRASYYVLGALLARFKKAKAVLPGGCSIGLRPIDQHIKGFEALGAKCKVEHGTITVEAERLIGTTIYLDVVSVGSTINIMLAAAGAEGRTVIENAAREPEVVDVANFLNGIGVKVRGAGTATIRITGNDNRTGVTHPIIPDRIEAATWLSMAVATNSNIKVENVIPVHLEAVIAKLREMGAKIEEGEDFIKISANGNLKAVDLKTFPYPGLPTDIQSQMMIALLQAKGVSTIIENIFDNRFRCVSELRKMGVDIKVDGSMAMIEGPQSLSGALVYATDLRCAAALIIAGLCAEGETIIENIFHLDRGYEHVIEKLSALGAEIVRETYETLDD